MSVKNRLSQSDLGLLIVLSACILGGGLRLYTAYQAGFPINDGGLFYVMTEAIQQNGYVLPQYVYFNGLEIPFAYPPFGFYFAGLINDLLGIPLIEVFRWLPAVVLSISIYAFYVLATRLLGSNVHAGVATVVYALLPRSITWLIMGGGITRSFGQLFLIITAYNVYMLFSGGSRKYLWLSILSSSLVCMTHPEASIHTIGIAILIWAFKGRTKKGVFHATVVAAGTLILTSIWWLPTLLSLGSAPFLSAAQTGLHDFLFIVYFFTIPFSDEPYLTIIILLAIIGIAVNIAKKDYLLPVFYLIPFIIEPRNAANVNTIPMAMLASIALCQLLLPGLKNFEEKKMSTKYQNAFLSRSGKILQTYLMLTMFIGMLYFSVDLAHKKVSDENLKAFDWVSKNTPTDSHFILLTGNTGLFGDWTQEWFPALTERISQTTIQGQEWLIGKEFLPRTNTFREIQLCLTSTSSLDCIESLAADFDTPYDYIYISVNSLEPSTLSITTSGSNLIYELRNSNRYKQVYRVGDIAIFERRNEN